MLKQKEAASFVRLKGALAARPSRSGFPRYYGVKGNSRMTGRYFHEVSKLMFKWLNRRSQRKSSTWAQFGRLWGGEWQVPRLRVMEQVTVNEQGEFVLEPTASGC